MLPSIGFMIGFYSITSMVSILSRSGRRSESGLVKLLAVVTILVTIGAMFVLLMKGLATLPT